MTTPLNLEKLLTDVFAPQPGEAVLVMTDQPTPDIPDHPNWQQRRAMAEEWRRGFISLDLNVAPLLTFAATGAHNADLPELAEQDGKPVDLQEALAHANIVVALTEFSATAPLMGAARKSNGSLRVASMPGVLRSMEQTALAADYSEVARRAHILQDKLTKAHSAEAVFSTGHRLIFDLRHRTALSDDGQCHPGKSDPLINLPSGEGFIVPYEGELENDPSLTNGEIPIACHDATLVLTVEQNRIIEINGPEAQAADLNAFFEIDPARRNIAELGLGCNNRAIVSGCVLEDEKVGMHWAYGRSEHLGGTVAPSSFSKPEHVVHQDVVYAKESPIGIASLTLLYPDDTRETIMRDSAYTLFENS